MFILMSVIKVKKHVTVTRYKSILQAIRVCLLIFKYQIVLNKLSPRSSKINKINVVEIWQYRQIMAAYDVRAQAVAISRQSPKDWTL